MIQGIHQTVTMDTYLRRTYAQKKRLETEDYPFWDYRSRRGAFCSSGSLCSSATSSSDGSSISSISCRSESSGESLSLSEQSDAESLLPCEQQRNVRPASH
ncbi:hypothetical protein DPMN_141694 [Dreissena polymorpha]|uniref:Uncharacterized protein n=1 Tax=Dreissena polymorpha TaxID=45954 RepID=A0A9D4GFV7_DREPO|nr:hypothetical protein DPMN_141694 [Dreissena polymorpha]